MKVKNLISTVSHKIHLHDDSESEFQLTENLNVDAQTTTAAAGTKIKKKKVFLEAEYKSKWDQFCDFTSLNGFRLLSSKFSPTLRIATATIMLFATCGLCWNLSGAFIKFFNPSGQKNTVFHQSEFEKMELPQIQFCHQSKNARANIDPEAIPLLQEDSKRLLHLYNIEELNAKIFETQNIPYLNYFLTTNKIANINETFQEKNCAEDFYYLQNQCQSAAFYEKYCSLFRSPQNSTTFDDFAFENFQNMKFDYDDCWLNSFQNGRRNISKSNNIDDFYCCRLAKTYTMFNKIKNENFNEYLKLANNNNNQDIFLWSSNKNLRKTEHWNALYGKCEAYNLDYFITDSSLDGMPLYSIDFLLNTFAFDSISDNGIIAFFIFDNYQTNEFFLLPNARTTIKVKDSLDINDFDCAAEFPSICSDAVGPYNDKVCEECFNARKNCPCNNPLRKSDNFFAIKDSNCNVHDSLRCLLQKTPTDSAKKACPEPCFSKYFKTFTTMDNLNISALNQTSEEMENNQGNFILTINYLINSIDNISIPFPPGNHALWNAVDSLQFIFEQYWKVMFYVTKLAEKPFPFQRNFTERTNYFKEATSKSSAVNKLVQEYFSYVIEEIEASLFNNFSSKAEINFRSIEANLLSNGIPNPPAIVNFYKSGDGKNYHKSIEAIKNLKKNIEFALGQSNLTKEVEDTLNLLNSLEILQINGSSLENNTFFTYFSEYLEEYEWFYIDSYEKSLTQLTLTFTTKQFSKIDYFQSYTFWNFLSDVGGIMGLYFGLTMVALYEMITFAFIDREPPESFTRKEKKLTRKTLYPKVLLSDEPIPSIF